MIAIGPSAKLFRSRLNNTIDTTFGDTGYVTGPAADVQIAYDGTILYLDTQTRSKITRLWNSDRPVAQIDTKNLRAARTTATRFSIFWRDDDGMNESSIDDTDVRVTGPFDGGTKTRTAIVESKETLSDGRIFVVYRVTSPGGWTNADNGLFSIKVLGNTIQDKNGVGNLAQTLGSFRVKIG